MSEPRRSGQPPAPATHSGRRRILAAAATVLALTGLVLLVRAAHGQQTAPQPTTTATATAPSHPATSPGRVRRSTSPPSRPYLPASRPVRIAIPAIGVHAQVMRLGLNHDGSIEVPPLDEKTSRAGWYENSPTPGQLGPAIILGHIDSARHGPAVFFRLGALHHGDHIDITRADHTTAHFTVDHLAEYPKNHFPTDTVYASTDHATLRLITCGGRFDPNKHSYQNNLVVYATLHDRSGR